MFDASHYCFNLRQHFFLHAEAAERRRTGGGGFPVRRPQSDLIGNEGGSSLSPFAIRTPSKAAFSFVDSVGDWRHPQSVFQWWWRAATSLIRFRQRRPPLCDPL
jgi:hypothetical protein